MASNLTVESPNFDRIAKEAGNFTSDAVSLLWAALNQTRRELRIGQRLSTDLIEPKVLSLAPSASVNNLDLQGCSVVSFTGSSSVNFTGMRAPDTNVCRIVVVQNSGTGTITVKHDATSETANRLTTAPGTDYSMTTGKGIIFAYLASKWREVARSG